MKVTFSNTQRALSISSLSVKKLVACILEDFNVHTDEVFIHFVNKEKISNLHQQFFDDPSPTDCISFPIDTTKARKKEFSVLGEIFVCPKVAIEYATAHTIDPYLELSLYTVHGLLHLLGYDDLDPKQRKEMRREEKRCLKLLTEQNRLIKSRDKSC